MFRKASLCWAVYLSFSAILALASLPSNSSFLFSTSISRFLLARSCSAFVNSFSTATVAFALEKAFSILLAKSSKPKLLANSANFLATFSIQIETLPNLAITSVNEGMKKFKGNILFTSHDHELTQTVANRIIDIKEDGTVVDREVTYNEYLGVE